MWKIDVHVYFHVFDYVNISNLTLHLNSALTRVLKTPIVSLCACYECGFWYEIFSMMSCRADYIFILRAKNFFSVKDGTFLYRCSYSKTLGHPWLFLFGMRSIECLTL